MPIRILPPEIVAKIAAGEVVERPASVVKELIENAIDAGATEIRVEVQQGGRRLMRVSDNGIGIPSDEVELAFTRHATSKITSADDLFRIATLGFRGEALASIAAVAQVTLVTRAQGEEVGTRLRVEEGRIVRRQQVGAPPGTIVTVENLFHNVPARLKFLRRPATEGRHITTLVTRYALAYPELRFTLLSDGRLTFQSPGSGKLFDVLVQVYGPDTARQMIEIPPVSGTQLPASSIQVSGYISPPALHRANREHMTFFVNRRWIHDRMLLYAVNEAYHTLLPTGRYPLVVLNLTIDPAQVDVNVHPAKAEVRFRDQQKVFQAVQRAVRRALVDHAPVPEVVVHAEAQAAWQRRQALVEAGERRARLTQMALELQRPAEDEALFPPSEQERGLPPLRVIGQVAQTYIIAEGPTGLYLIDQHAAHERVLYERLLAQKANAQVASQTLLEPRPVELPPGLGPVLEEHLDVLTELGFQIEPFGGETYLLRAVPTMLEQADPAQALLEMVEELTQSKTPLEREREERVIAAVCKQGAVKAGQTLSLDEMRELVRQLEQTTMPRTCPHGRPTMIHLSQATLEREFGRR